ncbi:TfoX/Sxy family protein [Actinomadura sediminis]|uniref:TfoX/Sxy family protein n=1 Tax=Actinomadura sediminis TaxID=1038904 RepID=A0ABW3EN97_9ACTN
MAHDEDVANRVREALADERDVREVRMFGGLAFMVRGKMAATANAGGRLMVRCDPDRADELLERPGASWPEMRGKRMAKGWIVVDAAVDDDFGLWMREALAYNRRTTGGG